MTKMMKMTMTKNKIGKCLFTFLSVLLALCIGLVASVQLFRQQKKRSM